MSPQSGGQQGTEGKLSPQRKLAAILIADAVGYSRQMSEDEERTLRMLAARRSVIENQVTSHHGRVFAEAGDSVVAEFASAVEALKAGLAMQQAIAAIDEAAPQNEGMAFRVGINLGDVMVEGNNLFGDGVNIAERLQTLAPPGGICIAGSVHEQVKNKFDLDFVELGSQRLKNISHMVEAVVVLPPGAPRPANLASTMPSRHWRVAGVILVLLLLAVAAVFFPAWQGSDVARMQSGPPTVAVLPFANLAGDASQDYFCDGITQDTIAALGRFSNLYVLAKSATDKFRDGTAAELHQKLGAQYVVTGSLRRSGNRVRVSVDLTDTVGNRQLWSRQFESDLTDIFSVQDAITRDITGALAIKLSRIEEERALAKETRDLGAYDLFLRGRAEVAKGERSTLLDGRAMFERAIAIDPRYAAAIAALGDTYQIAATQGWTEFPGDALEKAEQLARQALGLSPELAEANQVLAFVYLARGDYALAIDETRRAIEINPSDAYAHAALGQMLMWTGDAEGAIAALEKARIFDPTLQSSSIFPLGFAYYLVGRYEDARAIFESIGKDGGIVTIAGLTATYAELGRQSDAELAAAEVMQAWPFFKIKPFVDQWKDERSRKRLTDGLAKAGLK